MGNRLTELVVDAPDARTIYRFYLTESEAITAFKLGQVDTLPDLTDVGDTQLLVDCYGKSKISYRSVFGAVF